MRIRFVVPMVAVLAAPLAASPQHAAHPADSTVGLVEHVRQITEPFGDVARAMNAGYIQFLGCVSGPQEGAMGVHYVNLSLFDDHLDVEHPEALVYEPRRGRLQLVAAEYITPAAAWHASHPPNVTPQLMGHLYHLVTGPNRYGPDTFYEIHVWAWRENRHGAFSDWNPDVSCSSWLQAN